MKNLCIRCDSQLHTNPSNADSECACSLKTCGCYINVRPISFGFKKGKK